MVAGVARGPARCTLRGSQTAQAMSIYNILGVYYLANEQEKLQGFQWYRRAREVAEAIAAAQPNAIDSITVAGVIAALSPNNRWERNCADAELVCRLYSAGGAEAALQAKVCTYKSNLVKAVKILELDPTGDLYYLIFDLLNGPKIREFFNCIIGEADVCIDGHAYAIWSGQRLTMKEIPSIGKKLRQQIKRDYMAAAQQAGIRSHEMQATTWVTWKRLHNV